MYVCTYMCVCVYIYVQPIAFGVSILQSQHSINYLVLDVSCAIFC